MIVFFNQREFIACDAQDEERVKADFFKTRDPAKYTRLVVGDYAYVRATASRGPALDGGYDRGAPMLLVTSNLSDHKL